MMMIPRWAVFSPPAASSAIEKQAFPAVHAVIGDMSKRNKSNSQNESRQGWSAKIPSPSKQTWWGIGAIVVLTAAVYLPAIRGGALLDDDLLLTQNPIIHSPSGLYQFWFTAKPSDYWPVTNSSFWIEWQLWGEHLTGYHLTNLALHVAESLLIWLLLRELGVPGAFWGALLFAVHPANVESVAWIASRKNLVAMLFLLLSLWCYLKAEIRFFRWGGSCTATLELPGMRGWQYNCHPNVARHPNLATLGRATAFSADEFAGAWYWLSFAAFVLAALGKGSAVVLPALLLCILWWRRPLESRDLRRMLPFFAAGVLLAVVNVIFQTHDTEKIVRNVDLSTVCSGPAASSGSTSIRRFGPSISPSSTRIGA